MNRKMLKRVTAFLMCMIMLISAGCSKAPEKNTDNSDNNDNSAKPSAAADENVRNSDADTNPDTDPDADSEDGPIMELGTESRVSQEDFEKNYNVMALKLLRESLKSEGNTMISPMSVETALIMAAVASKGETFDQLSALICPGATKADMDDFASDLIRTLNSTTSMHTANSVWINDDNLKKSGSRVNKKYINLLQQNYDARASVLPFDDAALKEVNDWISDKTNGMVRDMLRNFNEDTFMLLINALAFESEWSEQSTYTNDEAVFTDAQGNETKHKAFYTTESYYLNECGAKGFMKYYAGWKYAFVAMLPDDSSISLKDYLASLPDDAFTKFIESKQYHDVETTIPCFSFDYEIELKDALTKLGVNVPFDPADADFYDMLEEGTYDPSMVQLWIERVLHKTRIELDENGTKAAAATIVEIDKGEGADGYESTPYYVDLDRPFIFGIIDTGSGLPVFIGAVEQITNE